MELSSERGNGTRMRRAERRRQDEKGWGERHK